MRAAASPGALEPLPLAGACDRRGSHRRCVTSARATRSGCRVSRDETRLAEHRSERITKCCWQAMRPISLSADGRAGHECRHPGRDESWMEAHASVVHGSAPKEMLETYHRERWPVGEALRAVAAAFTQQLADFDRRGGPGRRGSRCDTCKGFSLSAGTTCSRIHLFASPGSCRTSCASRGVAGNAPANQRDRLRLRLSRLCAFRAKIPPPIWSSPGAHAGHSHVNDDRRTSNT